MCKLNRAVKLIPQGHDELGHVEFLHKFKVYLPNPPQFFVHLSCSFKH